MKNAALSCRKRSSKTLPPPAGCHLIIPVNSLLKWPFTTYESMKLPHVMYIQHSSRHSKWQDALLKISLKGQKIHWTIGQFQSFQMYLFFLDLLYGGSKALTCMNPMFAKCPVYCPAFINHLKAVDVFLLPKISYSCCSLVDGKKNKNGV